METLINQLCGWLRFENVNITRTGVDHPFEEEIKQALQQILEEWVSSYQSYREYSGGLLECLDRNFDTAQLYLLLTFNEAYEEVMRLPVTEKLDLSILAISPPDGVVDTYRNILYSNPQMREGRWVDMDLQLDQFSDQALKELTSMLLDKLQMDAQQMLWDDRQMTSTTTDLIVLHGICKRLGSLQLFYQGTNIFLDKLFHANQPQLSRNLGEEILAISVKDQMNWFGYLALFRVYANQGSNLAALLYARLLLQSLKENGSIPNDKTAYEITWVAMRFFRNAHLYPFVIKVYEQIHPDARFENYERHATDYTYYSTLVAMKQKDVVSELADYLGKERESILAEGQPSIGRWLILLENINRLKGMIGFDTEQLDVYHQLFNMLYTDPEVQRQRKIIAGDSAALKDQLKETLLQLLATSFKRDFVFDNKVAIQIAHRMTEDSFAKQDPQAVLLNMIALTDLSMLFESKPLEDVVPVAFNQVDTEQFHEHFADGEKLVPELVRQNDQAIVWLASPENKLFSMIYQNGVYSFHSYPTWNVDQFRAYTRERASDIDFVTSVRKEDSDRVIYYLQEDYLHQANAIKAEIPFPPLAIHTDIKETWLVKDMEVAGFPHNLLLDQHNEFLGLRSAITDIISLDWLVRKRMSSEGQTEKTISAWFPVDANDFTIQLLYGKCSDCLEQRSARIYETEVIEQPLSSVINIISSHGGQNIGITHTVRPQDDRIIYDLAKIVGKGKVLIMLVCFSGSASKDFFRNEVASLVKKYLTSGYEAVIAPFWALNIEVPAVWLPVFLEQLDQGQTVSQANFHANRAVYDQFPTPGAWAAMHLYGNPFFKIDLRAEVTA